MSGAEVISFDVSADVAAKIPPGKQLVRHAYQTLRIVRRRKLKGGIVRFYTEAALIPDCNDPSGAPKLLTDE